MRATFRPAKQPSQAIVRRYFQKLQETTGKRFKPVGRQWGSYCSRVVGFRERENLTWMEYQEFVDKVFEVMVKKKGYVPNFGLICSSQVLGVIKNVEKQL